MADTFDLIVHNPAGACMEITHVYVSDHATHSHVEEAQSGEQLNFDEDCIDITVKVRNNGEVEADAVVEIRDMDNNLLESGQQSIGAGEEVSFNFTNGGNGYNIGDGETRVFIISVSP